MDQAYQKRVKQTEVAEDKSKSKKYILLLNLARYTSIL